MRLKSSPSGAALLLAACLTSAYAQERQSIEGHIPVYLSGTVSTILWGEPGARMDLQTRPARTPPQAMLDVLVRRPGIDLGVAEKTIRAAVPASDADEWRVLLPSLAQLSLVDVPRPEVGSSITVVGYPASLNDGALTLNATVLMIEGKAYALPGASHLDPK